MRACPARLTLQSNPLCTARGEATAAATASVLSHRVFCAASVSVKRPLFSLDTGAAFMKGETLGKISVATGEEKVLRRAAFFTLPDPGDWELLFRLDVVGRCSRVDGGA